MSTRGKYTNVFSNFFKSCYLFKITFNFTEKKSLQDTWRWREFQLLLQRQSPFWNWNLTSIHSSYDFSEKRTSVLFVSVSFIVLMLISLAWLVFYYVQRFRYIHAKDRMERKLSCQAKRALAIIPTIGITQEEGDEDGNMDTCAGKYVSTSVSSP